MQRHTVSEFFMSFRLREKISRNQTLVHLRQVLVNIGNLELNTSIMNILR